MVPQTQAVIPGAIVAAIIPTKEDTVLEVQVTVEAKTIPLEALEANPIALEVTIQVIVHYFKSP